MGTQLYNSLLLRLGGILRAIARTAFSRNRVPKVILRVSWLQSAIHLLRIVLHTHSYGESITTTAKVIRWWTRARYLIVVAIAGFLSARCDIVDPNAERAESRQGRGSTISVELVDEIDVVELISDFSDLDLGFDVQYPVATYSIVYQTIDANGDSTQASGALSMPNISLTSLPVVSYQHGTVTRREDVPSSSAKERIVGVAFAATGYFAVMPDYLGLGASPGMHPYVHAATSATAVVDMLRASVDFASANDISLAKELFLLGYSQGGYVTMAAHRALEADYADEFAVTASAPMAGPYDLSGTMSDVVVAGVPYPVPFYLPYVLFAYNAVYELYDSPSEFLISPYDTTLPPLFDGTHAGMSIDAMLPEIPSHILRPDMLDSFENDPDYAFRRRLRENDVYDWTPIAPVRMFHCRGDITVPKENAEIAHEHLEANGATVRLVDPLPAADHVLCAPPSILLAKAWFNTF